MSLHAVGVVYRKELREWLRDRRTLISTVLVPLLAFPILISGMISLSTVLIGSAKKEVPKIMIIHGEDSPAVVDALKANKEIEVVPYADNWKDQISEKQIRAAVEIPEGFQASLDKGTPQTIQIHYYEGELKSEFGAEHVEKSLKTYRDDLVKKRLEAKNLPDSLIAPFDTKQHNVAPPEKVGGASIGSMIGYMVIILSMTGAIYPRSISPLAKKSAAPWKPFSPVPSPASTSSLENFSSSFPPLSPPRFFPSPPWAFPSPTWATPSRIPRTLPAPAST